MAAAAAKRGQPRELRRSGVRADWRVSIGLIKAASEASHQLVYAKALERHRTIEARKNGSTRVGGNACQLARPLPAGAAAIGGMARHLIGSAGSAGRLHS
jgi:hypothetical protein